MLFEIFIDIFGDLLKEMMSLIIKYFYNFYFWKKKIIKNNGISKSRY